ncbi:MAG: hypothetical protein FJ128_03235 [Deltaproteobacteria bacterium]|nr:hypothetical protein [Deltaproteobacteria bacterium]
MDAIPSVNGRPADSPAPAPGWLLRHGNIRESGGGEDLERALVGGLLLEVLLDERALPEDPGSRRRQVKSRLRDTLVSRLAGRIPLNSFLHLARQLDGWFDTFYPLVSPGAAPPPFRPIPRCTTPPPPHPSLDDAKLTAFLRELADLLPRRRHRKLSPEGLLEFLRRMGGAWFRLKDFQEFFRLDRKTAWEYVQKLAVAGLFCRNQARSAAVRYRLESRFLRQP